MPDRIRDAEEHSDELDQATDRPLEEGNVEETSEIASSLSESLQKLLEKLYLGPSRSLLLIMLLTGSLAATLGILIWQKSALQTFQRDLALLEEIRSPNASSLRSTDEAPFSVSLTAPNGQIYSIFANTDASDNSVRFILPLPDEYRMNKVNKYSVQCLYEQQTLAFLDHQYLSTGHLILQFDGQQLRKLPDYAEIKIDVILDGRHLKYQLLW
jgi:hypothetical protein